MLPKPIKKFIEVFSALPSIGPRQAIRLAFHIKNLGNASIKELAAAIGNLEQINTCSRCFFAFENNTSGKFQENLCDICSNPQRRKDLIAVVEKETDLITLEQTRKFNGRYLVLGNLKKDGILNSDQKLKLKSLRNFIKKELTPVSEAEEIILAVNPTTYGDINAGIIAQELKGCAKKITRLGRGIPTGGEIEFADEETLNSALDNRT